MHQIIALIQTVVATILGKLEEVLPAEVFEKISGMIAMPF